MNKKQNFNIKMIKTQLGRSALSANAASAITYQKILYDDLSVIVSNLLLCNDFTKNPVEMTYRSPVQTFKKSVWF